MRQKGLLLISMFQTTPLDTLLSDALSTNFDALCQFYTLVSPFLTPTYFCPMLIPLTLILSRLVLIAIINSPIYILFCDAYNLNPWYIF